MKVLYIGGTGNISTASSKLAVEQGIDLYLLNRGNRKVDIPGAKTITADIYDTEQTKSALKDHEWDVVVNWIAFTPEHIQNDLELFRGKTKQYIFISTASAYQNRLLFRSSRNQPHCIIHSGNTLEIRSLAKMP